MEKQKQSVCEKKNQQRLNFQSIQLQQKQQEDHEERKKEKRPRPTIEVKDKVKKKRKLLSFEDEIQDFQNEELIKKAEKINKKQKRPDFQRKSDNLQEDLKSQFLQKTDQLKDQLFEIQFSYWDGPSIIKKLKRKKNQKIQDLLDICRLQLIDNFHKLAGIKTPDLLFVVKDFMVPHTMRICEVEALQLKTSTGQNLFNFRQIKIKDIILFVNIDGPIRIIEKNRYQKQINNYPFSNWRTLNVS